MEWAGHGNERPVMLGVHTQQQVPFLPRFVSLLRLRGRRAALMKRNFYHRPSKRCFSGSPFRMPRLLHPVFPWKFPTAVKLERTQAKRSHRDRSLETNETVAPRSVLLSSLLPQKEISIFGQSLVSQNEMHARMKWGPREGEAVGGAGGKQNREKRWP